MVRDDYKYAYIDTATTTQVFTGKCKLIAIVVGETAAGAISIIDGIAGSTANVGTLKTSIVEGRYEFNASIAAGIRIVTAAASKITVIYANA
jgi:hypothetical protein